MFRYIAFLFLLPLLAHCDDDPWEDGPCPKPTAEEKSKLKNLKGQWWLDQTDMKLPKQHKTLCFELKLEKNGDGFNGTSYFKIDNKTYEEKQKAVPVKGQPGRWTNFEYNKEIEKYNEDGFVCTTIKILVEEDGAGWLDYVCQEKNDKHFGVHRIFLSQGSKNEEKLRKELLAVYKKLENSKSMFKVEHKDCDSEFSG